MSKMIRVKSSDLHVMMKGPKAPELNLQFRLFLHFVKARKQLQKVHIRNYLLKNHVCNSLSKHHCHRSPPSIKVSPSVSLSLSLSRCGFNSLSSTTIFDDPSTGDHCLLHWPNIPPALPSLTFSQTLSFSIMQNIDIIALDQSVV